MDKKVEEYIKNIEQLGADARYCYNNEKTKELLVKLESIIYWTTRAINNIEK